MNRWIVAALVAAGMALTTLSTSVIAQGPSPATGTPGEPQCHGERVSFGSKEFGLTPKDRADINQISVREFHERVRASCEEQEQGG